METNVRPQYFSHARLAEAQLEGPPAFLADTRDGLIVDANGAAVALGLAPGDAAPATLASVLRAFSHPPRRMACLARLRPPSSLSLRLFRCAPHEPGVVLVHVVDGTARPPRRAHPPAVTDTDAAPRRFTFETDMDGRFLALSESLAGALGTMAARILGASLDALEEDGLVDGAATAHAALKAGATFSGARLTVTGHHPLDVEIGAIPLLGRERTPIGMRGFGIARALPRLRHEAGAPPPLPLQEAAPNVVPLRGGTSLTATEQSAFQEIARTLSAAVEGWPRLLPSPAGPPAGDDDASQNLATLPSPHPLHAGMEGPEARLMDLLPVALLVEQDGELVHANGTFHRWTGHGTLAAFARSGGLAAALERDEQGRLLMAPATGEPFPVEVRLLATPFRGRNALVYILRRLDAGSSLAGPDQRRADRADARREALDLLPWPVLLLEEDGLILFANAAAADLLGQEARALVGTPFPAAVTPRDGDTAKAALAAALAATDNAPVPAAFSLRTETGSSALMRATLSRGGIEDRLVCVMLTPDAPQAAAPSPPPPQAARAPEANLPACPSLSLPSETPAPPQTEARLADLAGRLSSRLGPAMDTVLGATDSAETLPQPVAEALRTIRAELADLSALATIRPPQTPQACDLAQVVRAALEHLTPSARRRGVRLRADIPGTAPVSGPEARVARLVRLIIADAVTESASGQSVTMSLEHEADGRATLHVTDTGAALDEVAEAHARAPHLAPLDGDPRPMTGGEGRDSRILGFARLVREAEALGGTLVIRRGLADGHMASLSLPFPARP